MEDPLLSHDMPEDSVLKQYDEQVKSAKRPKISKPNKVPLGGAIVAAVITLAIGIFIGRSDLWSGFLPFLGFNNNSSSSYGLNWSSLNEVYNKLVENYDGDIDKNALLEGAKKGLVAAIEDKYTTYMTAEEAAEYEKTVLHGEVGAGVGAEFGLRDGYVRILRTLPDNPARKAGMLAGDIIYKVNGEEVYTLTTEEIAQKIRGEAGTKVEITVVRDGEEKTFKLTREEINNVSADVEYKDDTAIIKVTRFDNDTGTIIEKFAREFEGKGIKKVILDLRGNGGGYVSAAKDLLSLWIDGEPVLVQKSKHLSSDTTYASHGKAILKDMETIVLVNGSTASASEIVTGALKDYGLAKVIGEQTFGKGVVQSLLNLNTGAQLKVTTAHWYTPKDNTINGTGITPDIIVERTFEDINKNRDPQLDRALRE